MDRMFMDGVARYKNTFVDDKLDLQVMLGASQEMRRDQSFSARRYDWVDPSVNVIDGFTGESTSNGSRSEWAMRSYFDVSIWVGHKIPVGAEFAGRRFFTLFWSQPMGLFPSFSAAWRVEQERFMEGTRSWLNALKLRVSYGELGNNYLSTITWLYPLYTSQLRAKWRHGNWHGLASITTRPNREHCRYQLWY